MTQSQSLGGQHHQQQLTAGLVYAPQSSQNHQSLKTESVEPSQSLPTPEMSPVEGNERDAFVNGVRYFPGVIRGTGHTLYNDPPVNPVSQLISRFSDGSTFLRNVCPPFRAREPSPPNSSQQTEQVPSNTYEIIRVSDGQNDHWSSYPVSGYEKMCNYPYDKNELRESSTTPTTQDLDHDHQISQQQIIYNEYRIPDQFIHHHNEMINAGHHIHVQDQSQCATYPTDNSQNYTNHGDHVSNYRSTTVICENNSAELMAALAETREIIS